MCSTAELQPQPFFILVSIYGETVWNHSRNLLSSSWKISYHYLVPGKVKKVPNTAANPSIIAIVACSTGECQPEKWMRIERCHILSKSTPEKKLGPGKVFRIVFVRNRDRNRTIKKWQLQNAWLLQLFNLASSAGRWQHWSLAFRFKTPLKLSWSRFQICQLHLIFLIFLICLYFLLGWFYQLLHID